MRPPREVGEEVVAICMGPAALESPLPLQQPASHTSLRRLRMLPKCCSLLRGALSGMGTGLSPVRRLDHTDDDDGSSDGDDDGDRDESGGRVT